MHANHIRSDNRNHAESIHEESFPCDITCFQHCQGTKVYCIAIPQKCPLCKKDVDTTEFHIPPFKIHLPLANKPSINSLVIKPSHGSFTSDFTLGQRPLHIGISNSHGVVFEYDQFGLLYNFNPSNWNGHVAISLAKLEVSCELLDEMLNNSKGDPMWSAERYDDTQHNCFDFVIAMLNFCRKSDYDSHLTKLKLAEEVMMPVLKRILSIVSLFKKVISANGICFGL